MRNRNKVCSFYYMGSDEEFYFYLSNGVTIFLLLLSEYLGSTTRHESNSIYKLICCCFCITSIKQAREFIAREDAGEPIAIVIEVVPGDKVC